MTPPAFAAQPPVHSRLFPHLLLTKRQPAARKRQAAVLFFQPRHDLSAQHAVPFSHVVSTRHFRTIS
jgi:hypothetical protein